MWRRGHVNLTDKRCLSCLKPLCSVGPGTWQWPGEGKVWHNVTHLQRAGWGGCWIGSLNRGFLKRGGREYRVEEEELVHTSVSHFCVSFVRDHCMHTYLFTSITVGKCQCICMYGCMHICTSAHVNVCISVRKHDLMQHGIPNTSGALSIFFLARTSCSPERFRRYMTFMRLPWAQTCCPDNWDGFSAMTTKRQILSRPNLSGPPPTQRLKSSRREQNLNKSSLQLIRRENTWREMIRREDRSRTWRGDWIWQTQTGRESSFPC